MKETVPKLGEIINRLMAHESPKKVAFEARVSRDSLYEIRQRWPLFLGWTNEYKRDD